MFMRQYLRDVVPGLDAALAALCGVNSAWLIAALVPAGHVLRRSVDGELSSLQDALRRRCCLLRPGARPATRAGRRRGTSDSQTLDSC